MKIWKHSGRIFAITVLMLSSVMVFGYLFNAFSELHAMDLRQDRSAMIGVELAGAGNNNTPSNEPGSGSEEQRIMSPDSDSKFDSDADSVADNGLVSESDGQIESDSDTEEADLANQTAAYIEKSMSDSGLKCKAEVDQANRCIAVRVLSAGICQAVIDGNRDAWSDVCSLAAETSAGWAQALTDAGLEDWHFSVVILNDQYPKYALLISTDGSTVYDCTRDTDLPSGLSLVS